MFLIRRNDPPNTPITDTLNRRPDVVEAHATGHAGRDGCTMLSSADRRSGQRPLVRGEPAMRRTVAE